MVIRHIPPYNRDYAPTPLDTAGPVASVPAGERSFDDILHGDAVSEVLGHEQGQPDQSQQLLHPLRTIGHIKLDPVDCRLKYLRSDHSHFAINLPKKLTQEP